MYTTIFKLILNYFQDLYRRIRKLIYAQEIIEIIESFKLEKPIKIIKSNHTNTGMEKIIHLLSQHILK